jgi:hypothetical protein
MIRPPNTNGSLSIIVLVNAWALNVIERYVIFNSIYRVVRLAMSIMHVEIIDTSGGRPLSYFEILP